MRLSTSLTRNIMETPVGGILNKFIVKRRRSTLFFEDIIASYIKRCEDAGYAGNMQLIGQIWMNLATQHLIPESMKKLPVPVLFNMFLKKVWINIGNMDDLYVTKRDNIINIKTKNEIITRFIGPNKVSIGIYMGILNILFDSQVKCIGEKQTKKSCEYTFELEDTPFSIIKAKEKAVYDKLNYLEVIKGITLKDALEKRILQLKSGNRVYFRGLLISTIENTIFHLFGNHDILLDEVPTLSYNLFNNVIEKESTNEQRLTLLKNLLQVMGWGIVNIVVKDKNEILIEVKDPPHGLQLEKDNWLFLNRTILGYLWLLNTDFRIEEVKESYKNLKITYLSK